MPALLKAVVTLRSHHALASAALTRAYACAGLGTALSLCALGVGALGGTASRSACAASTSRVSAAHHAASVSVRWCAPRTPPSDPPAPRSRRPRRACASLAPDPRRASLLRSGGLSAVWESASSSGLGGRCVGRSGGGLRAAAEDKHESAGSPPVPGFGAEVLPSNIEEDAVPSLGRHGVATPVFGPRGTCDTLSGGRGVAVDGGSVGAGVKAEAPTAAPRNDGSEEGEEDDPVVSVGRSEEGAGAEVQHVCCSGRESVTIGPTDPAIRVRRG